MNAGMQAAIEAADGQARLAERLGVSQPTISEWLHEERPVPTKRCVQMEREVGVPRQKFRDDWADHWPELVPQVGGTAPAAVGVGVS